MLNLTDMKKRTVFLIILILPLTIGLFAQKQGKKYSITGQVVDVNDRPVPDAIILVDNQNTNIKTNTEGMYKIRVKADAKTISAFNPVNGQGEEEINKRTIINFKLPNATPVQTIEEKEKPETEKINIGYGSTTKKESASSVSKVEGKSKKYGTYQTIYDMLREDPSVQLNGTSITIRGIGSINTNDPLLIVDGIVVSTLSDISPNMVESISILKGSDASMYGSRGANGVIIISLTGKK
jgi:TonB-dependent SusC/RagA subfamily outer membrane receptor